MKVITLKQPFAELILQGKHKTVLKNWVSLLRGECLIYAAQNPDEKAMKKFGFSYLPSGRIVGRARLKDVRKRRDIGKYEWVFEDVERIDLITSEGKEGFGEQRFHDESELDNDYRFIKLI